MLARRDWYPAHAWFLPEIWRWAYYVKGQWRIGVLGAEQEGKP